MVRKIIVLFGYAARGPGRSAHIYNKTFKFKTSKEGLRPHQFGWWMESIMKTRLHFYIWMAVKQTQILESDTMIIYIIQLKRNLEINMHIRLSQKKNSGEN